MKITQISRKVTGANYSNIELTATVTATEDVEKCAIDLDRKCVELLQKIQDEDNNRIEKENNKLRMLYKIEALKQAIEKENVDALPF